MANKKNIPTKKESANNNPEDFKNKLLEPGTDGKIHGVVSREKVIIERGGIKYEIMATIERF